MTLLYFPDMHPELLTTQIPEQVFLLDPGLALDKAEGGSQKLWHPPGLPLEREQVKRYLQQVQDLGLQFKNPKELALQARSEGPQFFEQTSSALAAEFKARFQNQHSKDAEQISPDKAQQAQMLLLLAWSLEEHCLALHSLEYGLQDKWCKMQDALGLDEERPDFFPQQNFDPDVLDQDYILYWPMLLVWFLFFLQPGQSLYVDRALICKEWEEYGLEPQNIKEHELQALGLALSQESCKVRYLRKPGWELALHKRPVPEKPWLDQEYTVILAAG